jgi:aerobic-type carbon monoxide dehydrogenase small subunit (CoxS/CutS family)
MASITLRVNGTSRTVDVDPATPLLYVLRNDLDLHGPRFGCGLGQCGACTVIIKGEAVRSCIRPVSTVAGAEITTLEGIAQNGKLHPLQQAWIDEQVPACGFCQNGQIMTAKALLDKNPTPTDAQIRQGHGQHLVPLHDLLPDPERDQTRLEDDSLDTHRERGDRMTATRRDFLKTSSALVVGLTVAGDIVLDAQGTGAGPYPDLDYKQLDSWIVIRPDNTATFFVGKTDLGQGTGTAFRQIMADELDMPYDKTSCVMGVTDVTVDQGGSVDRMRCRPTDIRCAASPRKRVACCWRWPRHVSVCPWRS